jgi:GNAT superfamily N-acetyltransferase
MRLDMDSSLEVRPFTMQDEAEVLDLLRSALGEGPTGERSSRFFRWKHMENPFGNSLMLVAEAGGRILGLRAFMRWRLRADTRTLSAVRAVDTATLPEAQGKGVFSRLTREAVEIMRPDVDLVFNTPNSKSLAGYLKMGWRVVGRVPVRVHVKRPIRFLRRLRSLSAGSETMDGAPRVDARPAADVFHDASAIESLLKTIAIDSGRLVTDRSVDYLRWRYAAAPFDYRAITDGSGGELRGLALFRVRPRGLLWEATVTELLVASGERTVARRLLRSIFHAAEVDHVTCSFPAAFVSPSVLAGSAFVRAPAGPTLVTNPLTDSIRPDPSDLGSWALTLGDLEVF